MRVKAEGDGYSDVYTSILTDSGYCFMNSTAQFLTPGIGKPLFYPSISDLLYAVCVRKSVTIKVLDEEE